MIAFPHLRLNCSRDGRGLDAKFSYQFSHQTQQINYGRMALTSKKHRFLIFTQIIDSCWIFEQSKSVGCYSNFICSEFWCAAELFSIHQRWHIIWTSNVNHRNIGVILTKLPRATDSVCPVIFLLNFMEKQRTHLHSNRICHIREGFAQFQK